MDSNADNIKEPISVETESSPTKSYGVGIRTVAIACSVLLVLAVFVYGYGGIQSLGSLFGLVGSESSSEVGTDLSGLIFLNATTKDLDTGLATSIVPFVVYPGSGESDYLPQIQRPDGSHIVSLQYAGSADFSGAVLLGIPGSDALDTNQETPSIYYADTHAVTSSAEIMTALQGAVEVAPPTDDDYFREFPSVSTSQVVAYTSISKEQYGEASADLTSFNAEGWTIFVLDTSGAKKKITNGFAPKWVDGSRLAYLKNDGVYMYNTNTKEERLIWSVEFVPNVTTGFDVSDDGQFVVVANSEDLQMTIVRVLDWDSALVNLFKQVRSSILSPVFGPDNKYIAMIAKYSDDQAGILYYSMDKNAFLDKTTLFDKRNLSGLYLTDWQ